MCWRLIVLMLSIAVTCIIKQPLPRQAADCIAQGPLLSSQLFVFKIGTYLSTSAPTSHSCHIPLGIVLVTF